MKLSVLAQVIAAVTVFAAAQPARSEPPASPLLWGENLELDAGSLNSDWFLSQPALRAGLAAAHVQIVRIPVRGPSPTQGGIANRAEFQQAVRDVADLSMTPLVILRSPNDPSLAADDTEAVRFVYSVFGDKQVYYEWGNESDLTGQDSYVPPDKYVASWNATVPQLRAVANAGAKFMGPAGFQLNANATGFLRTFLAGVTTLPDAISWHEYTCSDDPKTTTDDCLNAIARWPAHIAAAKSVMESTESTIHTDLPMWIMEWNYTPTIVAGDSKHTNADFLQKWTATAMRTLAANGIAASMHFDVRDQHGNSLPLVNGDGSLAPTSTRRAPTAAATASAPTSRPRTT